MSIEQRCRNQQAIADRIFMDFKYTKPGSDEQIRSLETFHFLVCMWADFFLAEERTKSKPKKVYVVS